MKRGAVILPGADAPCLTKKKQTTSVFFLVISPLISRSAALTAALILNVPGAEAPGNW
jgi:hypothetical protein